MELIFYALLSYINRSGTFTRVGVAYFLYTGSEDSTLLPSAADQFHAKPIFLTCTTQLIPC
jgi:predicted Abi (CAAX) family protease